MPLSVPFWRPTNKNCVFISMSFKIISVIVLIFTLFSNCSLATEKCPSRKPVICYWASWAVYRPGLGAHKIDNINAELCTHIVYTFAGIDMEGNLLPLDKYNDIENGGFKKMVALKESNPCLKVMLAIGGWNEGSEKYSLIAETEENRKKFAEQVIRLLINYGFDGFDVDWEYPTQRGGIEADKENFVALLRTLKDRLRPRRRILSIAVTASLAVTKEGYDIAGICQETDFVSIMGYDMQSSEYTSAHSPLRVERNEASDRDTLDAIISYYKSEGCPPEKIILGVPAYGRSFTLENPLQNYLGAPITGVGREGAFTREAGFLGYNEICEIQKTRTGWQSSYAERNAIAYGWVNKLWVSYDDPQTIITKAKYVLEEGLGGMMMWSIDTDDFNGRCGQEKYPLLRAINRGLGNM